LYLTAPPTVQRASSVTRQQQYLPFVPFSTTVSRSLAHMVCCPSRSRVYVIGDRALQPQRTSWPLFVGRLLAASTVHLVTATASRSEEKDFALLGCASQHSCWICSTHAVHAHRLFPWLWEQILPTSDGYLLGYKDAVQQARKKRDGWLLRRSFWISNLIAWTTYC
jgi:hypothetical protein